MYLRKHEEKNGNYLYHETTLQLNNFYIEIDNCNFEPYKGLLNS